MEGTGWYSFPPPLTPVGDGFIVETTAAQVAYAFPAFVSTLSFRRGARLPGGWRHDLRRQIGGSGGAAIGAVASPAGPGDATASTPLNPAFTAALPANPTPAPRKVIGIAGIATPAVSISHEPGDGGAVSFGFDAGDGDPHGDGLALGGLAAGDAETLIPFSPRPGGAMSSPDGLEVGSAVEEVGRLRRV